MSRNSFVKVQNFLNSPVIYFLKCFPITFREVLMSGSRDIGVFSRKQFRIQSQYFIWLLLVTTEKLRITAGFFASLPFLTDLCNKRLNLSLNTLRSIMKKNSTNSVRIEQIK